MRGLAAGSYRVTPYGTETFEPAEAVASGTDGIVIRAVEPVVIEGRVETPPGVPVRGIRICAYREDRELEPGSEQPWELARPRVTRTDDEGRFVLRRLVGESFSVWAAHGELACRTARGVRADTRNLVLKLEEGLAVSGELRGADDAEVLLEAPDGRGATRWGKVGEDGRFTAGGLVPGATYRLKAWSKDRTKEATLRDVVPGRTDLVVELERRE
jgi:hypothetical protein